MECEISQTTEAASQISDNQGPRAAVPVLLDALIRDLQLLHFHQALPLGPKMPECHTMIEQTIVTDKSYAAAASPPGHALGSKMPECHTLIEQAIGTARHV